MQAVVGLSKGVRIMRQRLDRNENNLFRKRIFATSMLFALLIPISILSICVGAYYIPFQNIFKILFSKGLDGGGAERIIIWEYRVPRTLVAIISGAVFAFSGAILQGVTRNPLVSPFTIGVSSAASFGAALVIIAGIKILKIPLDLYALSGVTATALIAFTVAFVHTLLLLLIAYTRGLSPESLVLSGIALTYVYSAGITILEYVAQESALREYVYWIMGDLARVTWQRLYITLVALLFLPPSIYKLAWSLNALALGEESARSLGVDPRRVLVVVAVLASLLTAIVVSITGPIGFICLMAPHIARLVVGVDNRYLLPASIAVGASLLLLSDIVARIAIKPAELPVSAVTNVLGVVFFLSLFLSKRKATWV